MVNNSDFNKNETNWANGIKFLQLQTHCLKQTLFF